MNSYTVIPIYISQQQQKKVYVNNFKEILDQLKQSINLNRQLHSTRPLAMDLLKPAGEANPYFRFGYGPQKIFNHTQGQVLV